MGHIIQNLKYKITNTIVNKIERKDCTDWTELVGTANKNRVLVTLKEFRSCVKVKVAFLGFPS